MKKMQKDDERAVCAHCVRTGGTAVSGKVGVGLHIFNARAARGRSMCKMSANLGPVYHGDRRPSSDDSFHSPTVLSTVGTRRTEYHEALPTSANDEVRCDCTFTDDGNAP